MLNRSYYSRMMFFCQGQFDSPGRRTRRTRRRPGYVRLPPDVGFLGKPEIVVPLSTQRITKSTQEKFALAYFTIAVKEHPNINEKPRLERLLPSCGPPWSPKPGYTQTLNRFKGFKVENLSLFTPLRSGDSRPFFQSQHIVPPYLHRQDFLQSIFWL